MPKPQNPLGPFDTIDARALLHELLEGSRAATWILGRDFEPVWCNSAWERLLGTPREKLLARGARKTWNQTLRPFVCRPADFVDQVLASYDEGRHLDGLEGHWRNGANERVIRYSSQAIASGTLEGGRIESLADVTAERALELERRRCHAMEAVGRLAGGVAHDFNNILTSINGYSQLLDHVLPEGPQTVYVQEIRSSGNRAAELAERLVAISPRGRFHAKVTDPGLLIGNLESRLRDALGGDVGLELRIAQGTGCVEIDARHLEQALLALAVNARDAMPDGGRFEIEVSNVELEEPLRGIDPGSWVRLSVTDSGHGMEPEILERVFEPLVTTKNPGSGAGFGLAAVYVTISRSAGHILVDSELGGGTTFRIFLPRADSHA